MTQDNKKLVIRCTLVWPFLARVNDLSDKYQVDLANLDKKVAAQLKKLGVNVRKEDQKKLKAREDSGGTIFDRGLFVTAKSQRQFFTVYDGSRDNIMEDTSKIGNGTQAKVLVKLIPYNNKFGEGIFVGLGDILITDLVEYHDSSDELFEDEEEILESQCVDDEDDWSIE